ncbi:MAG: DUF2390 domain-containing protein [Oleiphilaceae bacterium]|nr:DUF2390 domain-containing protein [Oleiphilaceae bacterium]
MKVGAEIQQEAAKSAETATELLKRHSLQLDSPLWQFAARLWRDSAISKECLALQSRDWSVTRLLCASWQASVGLNCYNEPADVRAWRNLMTSRLRATRLALPKDTPCVSTLRKTLAQAELEAERIELALAYALLPRGLANTAVDTQTLARLMSQNLEAAAPDADSMDTDTSNLINTLSDRMTMQVVAQRQGMAH